MHVIVFARHVFIICVEIRYEGRGTKRGGGSSRPRVSTYLLCIRSLLLYTVQNGLRRFPPLAICPVIIKEIKFFFFFYHKAKDHNLKFVLLFFLRYFKKKLKDCENHQVSENKNFQKN